MSTKENRIHIYANASSTAPRRSNNVDDARSAIDHSAQKLETVSAEAITNGMARFEDVYEPNEWHDLGGEA